MFELGVYNVCMFKFRDSIYVFKSLILLKSEVASDFTVLLSFFIWNSTSWSDTFLSHSVMSHADQADEAILDVTSRER